MIAPRDLQPLLAPRSIAIVGASTTNPYASRLIDNLSHGGFSGPLYLVNPRQERLGDRPCHPNVAALPEAPDLAFLVVPQRAVVSVLDECGRKGIRAAVVISAGFGEAGDAGRVAEDAIRETADRHGLLVCGPNCLGLVNAVVPVMGHASSRLPLRAGNIALCSQSGAMAFASVLAPASDRSLGVSLAVSSGNEAVVDTVDYIGHFVRDPDTRVITSLLEGFKPGRGRAFIDVAHQAADAGKPIIVCKVGRSAEGARQVVSHTGSFTGSDAVHDAVFEQTGVIRVPDPDDLVDVASVFSRCPEPKGDGLAILSTSGGLGVLLADKCGVHGIPLPPLSPAIERALEPGNFFLVVGDLANPLDMRGQGSEHLPEILQLFIDDDRYHILTVALGLHAVGPRSARIAEDLIKVASGTDKPLIVLWMGTRLDAHRQSSDADGFRMLEQSRVPIFTSPDKYFRALRAFVEYHRFRRRRAARAVEVRSRSAPGARGEQDTAEVRSRSAPGARGEQDTVVPRTIAGVDRSAARTFVADREGLLDEVDSRRLLSFYGIPAPREALVEDVAGAVAAAAGIGYPVVAKIVSADIHHKTEAGAVRVGITDESSLRAAWEEMLRQVRGARPDVRIRGVLVQEMVTDAREPAGSSSRVPAREMIAGCSHDPHFGPVVLCGVGGVFVEALGDVSRRVPPLTVDDALDMIASLQASKTLGAFRGAPPADVAAVADVICRLGQLALDLEDRIVEIDVNPIMARAEGQGAVAVDALVVLRPLAEPAS